ncbi:MAG TPA: GNAT family protein [Thermomicrobiales bacterium]|nr:GNAT family protein [Thermomicrobiales bacterium]
MQADQLNITLRRASPLDAPFVDQIRNQPTTRRFQASPQRTIQQITEMLSEGLSGPLTRTSMGRFYWIALANGDPAGMVQLAIDQRDRSQESGTLGYTIAEPYQGLGIATVAVTKMLAIAFDPSCLAIQRLEAVAAVGNLASRRVLEKTGFQFEGIQRGLLIIDGQRVDHACYAMLESDEMARRK